MGELLRLDKYLADQGEGSRSQVKQLIKKGYVSINDQVIKKADEKINPEEDKIQVNGRTLSYIKFRYIMLHKPADVVSATEDKRDATVLSLLPSSIRKDLFPVGRLDKDTEGLLLLTNDGALAHRLLSPKKHVDKTYFAKIKGRVNQEDVEAFKKGIDIKDEKLTLPATLEILSQGEESQILLTIQEGRFHQVKRMFLARGKEVLYLKRMSMGPLQLDESLMAGEYRELTQKEKELLGV